MVTGTVLQAVLMICTMSSGIDFECTEHKDTQGEMVVFEGSNAELFCTWMAQTYQTAFEIAGEAVEFRCSLVRND